MKNRKKTIFYIGGFQFPDKNAAAQRVIANGKIFRDLGFNVVFIGVNNGLVGSNSNSKDTYKKQFGFDTWEVSMPNNKKEWINKVTNPIGLKDVLSQYDSHDTFAIIPYNHPAIAQYKIRVLCKKLGAFYIPDVTEWYEFSGTPNLTDIIKWLDTTLRMKVFNFQADALITTSPYLTKYYKNHILNILELPTLYDKMTIKEEPEKCNTKGLVKLLYAGSPFGPNITKKNRNHVKDRLDKIIALLGELKHVDYILNIYGLTKDRFLEIYPEFNQLLAELSKKIVFHGRMPHQEIILAIRESHYTIFFRDITRLTKAGFPTKLSESITSGTPVITNMISNLEPYLSIEKNIHIIDLNDENKQVAQMKQLLSLRADEINAKKQECLESKTFDYRSYIQPMKYFLKHLDDTTDESK